MVNLKITKTIRNLTLSAILVSLGVIFSFIDIMISRTAFPFLPTAKIGIANIVILIGIYAFDFKTSLSMSVLKAALTGLILGNMISFIISMSATLVSFFIMFLAHKTFKNKTSMVGVSVLGGFSHMVTQLFVVSVIYRLGDLVILYGALLVLVSLITSIIIGIVSNKLFSYLSGQNLIGDTMDEDEQKEFKNV